MANSNETSSAGQAQNQSPGSGKSFIASAQETLGGAFDATVGAVKEHPVAAAAIAAGTAAAVGGAVYAATQLRGDEKSSGNGSSGNSKK
jgi:hypothetical protein